MRPALGLTLAFILGLASAQPSQARTVYVRVFGNNANDGLSPGRALATVAMAAGDTRGGDVVIVGPGRYVEGDHNPDGNGRRGEVVRFVADPTGTLTGDAPGSVVIDARGRQNGFRISARPWVTIDGFTVTNASEAGIDIKSASDSSAVVNCVVFSNGDRGIRVRDSRGVLVLNNLVYANGGTGIDFGGELSGAGDGAAINNTVYANGLDGIRIEGVVPSIPLTLLNNVIAGNAGVGINLKENSSSGFVGQWNLLDENQIADYNTTRLARGQLDLDREPLLLSPPGSDGILGGGGFGDDDFRLSQAAAGQVVDSAAVDASAVRARKLLLENGSTRSDGAADSGSADLGFHIQAKVERNSRFVDKTERRLGSFRQLANQCQRQVADAVAALDLGRGPCTKEGARRRLAKRCGRTVETACR